MRSKGTRSGYRLFVRNVFLTMSFFIVNSLSFSSLKAEEKKLEVLAILPLSGDMANLGVAIKNGILLGMEQSDSDTRINMRFEDDGGLPKNTISALMKQKSVKKPDIIITASSATSKSVAPLVEQMKVPLIAIATDEEISRGRSYVMNFWVTPEDTIDLLIKEAKRRGYRSIAFFTSIHNGTISLQRTFHAQAKGELEIAYSEDIGLDLRDFKSEILKFKHKTKNKQIDAIFTNVFFGQVGIFARQLRELGVTQDLFCAELFEDKGEVASSQGALIDQWYVQADDPNDAFLKRYAETFPGDSNYGSANGADLILLLAHALEKKITTPEEINTFLHSVKDFEGNMGVFSASDDNRFNLPVTVKIVKEYGFEKCGEECESSSE
jgi:branched-chain amino acid transport system substrate-binding protein